MERFVVTLGWAILWSMCVGMFLMLAAAVWDWFAR